MSVRLLLVALAAATLAVACDDGDDSERRTGIELVDTVIEAVEAGDVEAIVSMMELSETPCYAIPRPEGELPLPAGVGIECEDGIADGTLVSSFLHASCEGRFMVDADAGEGGLRSMLESADPGVYAVYAANERTSPSDNAERVKHAVMLTRDIEGREAGTALLLSDSGIVGWDTDCGLPPDQMAEFGYGEAILPPIRTSDEQPATSD